MTMSKPLFLFVGKSASGKTTIANMLTENGYSQIASYTTRPPRYKGEKEHTFISEEEYDKLENIMAETHYNGYRYCTTLEQIKNADIYVVDPPGVSTLMDNYDKIGRFVYAIYFDANVYNRVQRMLTRGDSDTQVVGRLLQDEQYDWLETLLNIDKNNRGKMIMYVVDANQDLENVYYDVKNTIKRYI
jgi:guanylate kinase